MICPFNHEPCKYINCPLWSERCQACRFVLAIDKVLNEEKPMAQLTPKEQQILELITQGYSNQQISDALHVSVSTVKNHVSSVLAKLGVKSRVEAVLISLESKAAMRQG